MTNTTDLNRDDETVRAQTSDRTLRNFRILAARLSLAASVGAVVLLAALHVLSPEFDPSWRVVSEYALGRYGWVLSLMFLAWAVGSWALAVTIRYQVSTTGGRIGLAFLVAAGAGQAMASVFDLRHSVMHGIAGLLGVFCFPVAATLISVSLGRTQGWRSSKRILVWTANLTWISLIVLVAAMATLTRKTGPRLSIGWPNRFLVAVYCAWTILVAWQGIRLHRGNTPAARPE